MSNNIDQPHQAAVLSDKQNAATHTPRTVRLRENNTDNSPITPQETVSQETTPQLIQTDINNQQQNIISPPLPQSEYTEHAPQNIDNTTERHTDNEDIPTSQKLEAARAARAARREQRLKDKLKAKSQAESNMSPETTRSVLSNLYANNIMEEIQVQDILNNKENLSPRLGVETVSAIDTKALKDILASRDNNIMATDNHTDSQSLQQNITKDFDNILNNKTESATERLARVMQGVKVSQASSETVAENLMKTALSRLKGKERVALHLGESLKTMGIIRKKTDSLTLNLDVTNPDYKLLVDELSKRSQTDIRAGKTNKIITIRDNSPQVNVGKIFTGKKRQITDLTPFTPETQKIIDSLPRKRRRVLPADMRADSLRSTLLEQQKFQARILPNQPISVF